MFNTPVSDMVLVVVDPTSPYFGKVATFQAHDWKESGDMFGRFPDGTGKVFHDGMIEGECRPPGAIRILKSKRAKISRTRRNLPDLREKLLALWNLCNDYNLPMKLRLCAKDCFNDVLNEAEGREKK